MKISERGRRFIEGYESFVPYVYDDHVPPRNGHYKEWQGEKVKGTLTIGYGHTNAGRHSLRIKRGLRLTRHEADEILTEDLSEVEEGVISHCKVELTQGQFDALCSLVFNLGIHGSRDVFAILNRGDPKGAKRAFGKYVMSKGRKLQGLVKRRRAEQALWDERRPRSPVRPVHHVAEVHSSEWRFDPVKEVPEPPPPDHVPPEVIREVEEHFDRQAAQTPESHVFRGSVRRIWDKLRGR